MFARLPVLLALALLTVACESSSEPKSVDPDAGAGSGSDDLGDACGRQADGTRKFRILHLNDVYRIEGVADGRGGLARVRTLRTQLEQDCQGSVLITHAGDTIFPSLLSNQYHGAQMIEVLNALDGDPAGFDSRFIATFGNHEFDKGKLEDASLLDARVDESQFNWLGTTITWKTGDDGKPLVGGDNLVAEQLLELGGVKVGMFSLMVSSAAPAYIEPLPTDHVAQAKAAVQRLRGQGAEVVLALTHLDAVDDQKLLDSLAGADGPDVILGGHDHVLMTREGSGRYAFKGDADALRVRVIEIGIGPDGKVTVEAEPEGTAIGPDTPAEDPQVQAIIDARLLAFSTDFCKPEPPTCLTAPLTVSKTDLLAEELEIRRYETNFGDWILDQAMLIFAADKPDLAFLNSGTLRLNQNIAAGTPLTRQIVEETFAYPAPMYLIEIDGATVQQVLDHAITGWTGSGHWLQIAGVAFRHDVQAGTATNAVLVRADGTTVAISPKKKYRVVAPQFMLDPSMGNQDGYSMLSMKQVVKKAKGNGTDLKAEVLEMLTAAGEAGIAPQLAGRICSSDRPAGPCLVPNP
jgi:2',3'-cyclic-nucleotide 2'-phosphodiesterase (5'-nucleotidase family)